MRGHRFLAVLSAAALCPLLHGQQLTPRDAFWSASDLMDVSANPAAKKTTKPADATPGTPKRVPKPPSSKPPQTTAKAGGTAQDRGGKLDAEAVSAGGYGAQPHLVHTAATQLGLRYSLLLRKPDGTYQEASPTATFHTGDHLRLSVMANEPGYLYVIDRGSSGGWSPIFPAPNSAADANHVEQGRVYQIPGGSGQAFQFSPPAGSENLYVIFSREPIRDLDARIVALRGGQGGSAAPDQRPAPSGQVLDASNHIPDDLVERLASRDLTLVTEQQVDEPAKGDENGERAVYIVAKNTAGRSSNEVVAPITLRHD